MSQIETTTMQTTVIYNDDKTHRYLLRKEWDSDKYTLDLDYGYIGKVYVIDDGDHETMLLAEEY